MDEQLKEATNKQHLVALSGHPGYLLLMAQIKEKIETLENAMVIESDFDNAARMLRLWQSLKRFHTLFQQPQYFAEQMLAAQNQFFVQ